MLDAYIATKYNCPLSSTSLPCRMPCSTELASGYAVHSGMSQWWNPMVACLNWILVRLHHVATATTNITPCHQLSHMCGILLFVNKQRQYNLMSPAHLTCFHCCIWKKLKRSKKKKKLKRKKKQKKPHTLSEEI